MDNSGDRRVRRELFFKLSVRRVLAIRRVLWSRRGVCFYKAAITLSIFRSFVTWFGINDSHLSILSWRRFWYQASPFGPKEAKILFCSVRKCWLEISLSDTFSAYCFKKNFADSRISSFIFVFCYPHTYFKEPTCRCYLTKKKYTPKAISVKRRYHGGCW